MSPLLPRIVTYCTPQFINDANDVFNYRNGNNVISIIENYASRKESFFEYHDVIIMFDAWSNLS